MKLMTAAAACAMLAAVFANSTPAPSAEAPHANGRALYTSNGCTQCHGTVGQGNKFSGPKLAPHPLAYAAFIAQVRKPRGEMPPYSAHVLANRDAEAIYAYLVTIPAGKTAAQIPILAAVGKGNAGLATSATEPLAAGRIVFAQQCASCHGAAGGGGSGPSLIGERSRKNLGATIATIKHPQAPMPALYPAPLSDRDVANVAAYVQSL